MHRTSSPLVDRRRCGVVVFEMVSAKRAVELVVVPGPPSSVGVRFDH